MRHFLIISSCFLFIVLSCSKKSNNPEPAQQANNNNSGCFYSFSHSVRPYAALVSPDYIDSTNMILDNGSNEDSMPIPFPITIFDYTAKFIFAPGFNGMDLWVNDSSFIGIDALNFVDNSDSTKEYLSYKTSGSSPNRIFILQIKRTYPQQFNIQYSFFESNDSITIQYGENNVNFDGSDAGNIDITFNNNYNIGYGNILYGNLNAIKDTCISATTVNSFNSFGDSIPNFTIPTGTSIPTGTTFTFHKLK